MAVLYKPGLQYQAGVTTSVSDLSDAVTPNKMVAVPLVATMAVAANGTANPAGTQADPVYDNNSSIPAGGAAYAITPQTTVNNSALQAKASAGNLYGASMTAGATAGFLIAYNSATVPTGGAALTAALILAAVPVAANGFASIGGTPYPDRFSAGIVLLFSTSTTTYTVPTNLALHMRAAVV